MVGHGRSYYADTSYQMHASDSRASIRVESGEISVCVCSDCGVVSGPIDICCIRIATDLPELLSVGSDVVLVVPDSSVGGPD